MSGQRRLQVIDLFGQNGVDDGLANRLFAGLVPGLERERQVLFASLQRRAQPATPAIPLLPDGQN